MRQEPHQYKTPLPIPRKSWFRDAMRSAIPTAPLSNSPTPELRRHVRLDPPQIDRTQFRPGWRVRDHLNMLLKRGAISTEAYIAGTQWRRWCEQVGHLRVQPWNSRVDHAGTSTTPGAEQLAAARSLKAASAALGQRQAKLLVLALAEPYSWIEIGRACHIDWRTAQNHTIAALEELACWLGRSRRAP